MLNLEVESKRTKYGVGQRRIYIYTTKISFEDLLSPCNRINLITCTFIKLKSSGKLVPPLH
jgi:hypothetical protein